MKVFHGALLGTLVIGVLFSGLAPRKAHALMTLHRICTTRPWRITSNTGAPPYIEFVYECSYQWINVGVGRGGAPTEGSLGHPGGLGGGVGKPTVPNKGDQKSVQRDASAKTGCGDADGDPVVFSTGNEVMSETDFQSTGEMGLSLTRTYNHYWNGIGIFGRRWLSDYDYKLLFTTHDPTSSCYTRPGNTPCDPTGKPIWALRPDGRLIKFNYSTSPSPGWYEDKPSPIAKIIKSGSTYTLYSENHTVETYDSHGFPSTINNQQGVKWTFSYDANHYLTRVTNSSGRHVDFDWTNGLLTQVTDPAGNAYHYGYTTISVTADAMMRAQSLRPMMLPPISIDDPPPVPYNPPSNPPLPPSMVALLTSTTSPATQGGSPATVTTYHYEDSRFVTALTGKSINGSRWSWITYDANAMAIETRLAGGAEDYKFAYTLDGDGVITSTTVTNPLGRKTTYDFNADGNKIAMTGATSPNCPASYKAFDYDDNGYLSGVTDFSGNVTLFTYAANGELKKEVHGAGTSAEQTTDYAWDATYHRLKKVTVEGDHETSYSYNANNRLASVAIKNLSSAVSQSKGRIQTTTYTYTVWPNHLVKSVVVNGPLAGSGDIITLTYSEAGNLLSRKDALGHATTYGDYNALGLPGFVTGPNGDRRDFSYDARGRVVDIETHRDGGTQHNRYQYDGFGRLARATQPDGHAVSYQYDVAGRLTAKFEPEGDGTYDETAYTYNAMSLPISIKKQRIFVKPQQGTVP